MYVPMCYNLYVLKDISKIPSKESWDDLLGILGLLFDGNLFDFHLFVICYNNDVYAIWQSLFCDMMPIVVGENFTLSNLTAIDVCNAI